MEIMLYFDTFQIYTESSIMCCLELKHYFSLSRLPTVYFLYCHKSAVVWIISTRTFLAFFPMEIMDIFIRMHGVKM